LEFIQGDIADSKLVRELIKTRRPKALIHFAAETHVDRSIDDPSRFLKTNVMGTYELMEACRLNLEKPDRTSGHETSPSSVPPEQFRTGLPADFRFVLVSTDEVFGALGSKGLFSEKSPYAPNSPYSASKAGADLMARAYYETFGFPIITTHCSNNYGPYQFPEKLIPLMILNALEGKDLPVYGDGLQVRDWIHAEDHCEGIWEAWQKGKLGNHYLFGARTERTNLRVLETLLEVLEVLRPASKSEALRKRGFTTYKELIRFVQDRPGHDRRYAIDPSRAETELGWKPRLEFDSALTQTVHWYLDHLDWCAKVQQDNYGRERLGLKEKPRAGGMS